MPLKQIIHWALFNLCFIACHVNANTFEEAKHSKSSLNVISGLSDNIRITSKHLNYDLQYRIYLPEPEHLSQPVPVIYFTDGHQYIHHANTVSVLNQLINSKKISPVIAVFIDPRDPDNYAINRRNEQFFCNQKYIDFVNEELIQLIDNTYNTINNSQKRLMWGVSFGGLNAACFGLLSHHTFRNFAIQSPALHPIANINDIYKQNPPPPLKVYLSTGTINDDEQTSQTFKRTLKSLGHQVKFKTTKQGHNWRNWTPMIDNILLYFFAQDAQ